MVAWRYEISLLVLKKIFLSFAVLIREIFFNIRREISYLRAAMYILYLRPARLKKIDLFLLNSN